ncbi:reverse transcriptase domain-containing protein [Tanacetum coccineum]|uniref:Reverse transcriptase domain-containing protein n=1 Tax=Tanacetum coccineum TaxID=301880 RepID=A0ABQ4YZ71_9ASTR
MYMDGRSASEILYEHCFSRLRLEIKNQLMSATTLLIGFSGEIIWPIGQIQLLVKIGDEEHSASAWMNFVFVRSPSPYNGIIGRPGVRKLQAISLTAHGMLKIPIEGGVITLKSSKLVPLECAIVSGPKGTPSATKPIMEERVKVVINPEYPKQIVMIGSTLTEEGRNRLCGQAADRNQAIQEEVGKLVAVGIIKEVHYHDWLSNPVMVKKHDDSWRMCIDFKDLNKACPKDGYPLPEIDWKIPFGLRNAGVTYQRLVDKAFHKQIGKNLEVYVDDLVFKSRTKDEIVRDIEETFKNLREINMKLNPKKCTFGVEEGMFLGFLAKSAEKSLPFFKTLKKCTKKSDFHWTTEVEEAFKQTKQLIAEPPMLTSPMEKEELSISIACDVVACDVVACVGAIRGTRIQLRFTKILAMSNHEQSIPSQPTSAVRNTVGKGKETTLTSWYSESKTMSTKEHEKSYNQRSHSRYTEALSESEDIRGWHWKSRSKKKKSCREEDDLSQPWVCEEVDPFTPRIRYFDFPKTRMPSHIKTYDRSEDLEDQLLNSFRPWQLKKRRWAMPTWCHVFNFTLTGNARVWFDDLPSESIDSYDDLKKAFLGNYLQQNKCIKDPIEIHNIKQREGESTEDFVKRYKLESRDVKGAPECMRISGFVHGITNPKLIKRLHDKILKNS